MQQTGLYWLPPADLKKDWKKRLCSLQPGTDSHWPEIVALAKHCLSLTQTNNLDAQVQRLIATKDGALFPEALRLAVLGSCTTHHLLPSLRVAGYRRGLLLDIYESAYGIYRQELSDIHSPLHQFKPQAVLFLLDARHITTGLHVGMSGEEYGSVIEAALEELRQYWRIAQDFFRCRILQPTFINSLPALFGENEQRLPGSRSAATMIINAELHRLADAEEVDLISLDRHVLRNGLDYWFSPKLWYLAKQEISPMAAPLFGDIALRPLVAHLGLSKKCLVLDLDNTIWGGVIGDDGFDGIVLGQGSAEGESYLAVQEYARELSRRGVILAVCSKNDEHTAWEPFDSHSDMLLRREDIACMMANWDDKATNMVRIADFLQIGLDSMVFVDDSPAERALVREKLPMVSVSEFPDDPADAPQLLADAGYFEGVALVSEDYQRAEQYRIRSATLALKGQSTDMGSYLTGLEMVMTWAPFQRRDIRRIVQLINKTNQFNLTTRRRTETEIEQLMEWENCLTLQVRLKDKFGDHGLISLVICQSDNREILHIDTWLMSCRVLGREVEKAVLCLLVQEGSKLGAHRLIGEYIPTEKNSIVKDHYIRLGFREISMEDDGRYLASLDLNAGVNMEQTTIKVVRDNSYRRARHDGAGSLCSTDGSVS
jgi:FkbH-like protein